MEEIGVSIICNTYNQKKYIAEALESFIMQKTTFPVEVLVHDDASTDGTAEIIREYEAMYPDIIKPIYQIENQYSKGILITQIYQFPRVKGIYIALCEGDDYWIDPLKLQKQYDIMEKNSMVDMCAHKAVRVNANTKEVIDYTEPAEQDCILAAEKFIHAHGHRVIETATLFFRVELARNIPEFRRVMPMDTTLRIHGALRGGIYYCDECMSAYRWLADGSWTVRNQNRKSMELIRAKRNCMFEHLDKETNGKYTDEIMQEKIELDFKYIYKWGDCRELKDAKYKGYIKSLDWKQRVKLYVKQRFPFYIYNSLRK